MTTLSEPNPGLHDPPSPSGDFTIVNSVAAAGERWSTRVPVAIFAVLLLLIMWTSVRFSGGGALQPELDLYIPHYLSQRPILQKIYDTNHVEIGSEYRPRPLSYLVDNYDVAFIGWSTRLGHPHLLSASSYVFWFADALLLWHFFRSYLQLDRLVSALLIGLLSTDPVLYMTTGYFRSAKGGATCFLLASFLPFAASFRNTVSGLSRRRRVLPAALGGLLLLIACLFDEQPFALAVGALAFLALSFFFHRQTAAGQAYLFCSIAIVLGLSVFAFYDLVVHRRLLTHFGQPPSMKFQIGLLDAMRVDPVGRFFACLGIVADEFGFLTGDLTTVLALGLMFLLGLAYSRPKKQTPLPSRWATRQLSDPAVQLLLGTLFLVTFVFGMVQRHTPLLLPAVRRATYYIPLAVIFTIVIGGALQRLLASNYLSRGIAQLLLLLLLASNAVSLRTHLQVLMASDTNRTLETTHLLIDVLRTKEGITPEMMQDPQRGPLYSAIAQHPAYIALHQIRQQGR